MKFGTDGMRGVFGAELLPQHAYVLGQILGEWSKKDKPNSPQILVGRDTRQSGKILQSALVCGICSTGANAVCLGVVPTPAVAFYMQSGKYSHGVMITASHNPWKHNGLKVFTKGGTKLSRRQEKQIEEQLDCGIQNAAENTTQFGTIAQKSTKEYKNHIAQNLPKGNLKIALDCANGATYCMARTIFVQKGYSVVCVGASPNGKNINKNCGSTNLSRLKRAVIENNCHIGFAFDGDGDRILAVDENGDTISGDQILFALAHSMLAQNKTPRGVVSTIMSSSSLGKALEALGIKNSTTQVGDKHVKEQMEQLGYLLGGEQSGHIIVANKSTTGDGVLVATELVRAMGILHCKASKLSSGFVPMFQYNISVPCGSTKPIEAEIKRIGNMHKGIRIVVRKSGTENVVRIMAEAATKKESIKIASYFQAKLLCRF